MKSLLVYSYTLIKSMPNNWKSKDQIFEKILEESLKTQSGYKSWNLMINNAAHKIREGRSSDMVVRELKLSDHAGKIVFDLAISRIRAESKFSNVNKIWLDSYSSRYSTPEIVALYRSERLKGYHIADIGSGAGMQSIFMAKNSKVTGIEVEKTRYLLSLLNSRAYDWEMPVFINNDFHNEDVSNLRPSIIFSDPLRPESEKERSIESLVPDPYEIMELYENSTKEFVFDLPPQMKRNKVEFDSFESEYISVNGSLNRFTVYLGKLRKKNFSAVLLPNMLRIESDVQEEIRESVRNHYKYVYSLDPAVIYAGLEGNVSNKFSLPFLYKDKRRIILTSDEKKDQFPGETFLVVGESTEEHLLNSLHNLGAGKIIPRYNPTNEYYVFKSMIESKLSGDQTFYLFHNDSQILICKKL